MRATVSKEIPNDLIKHGNIGIVFNKMTKTLFEKYASIEHKSGSVKNTN